MLKPLTEQELLQSFRAAEKLIEKQHKSGLITREKARHMIEEARKNYKNQNYNRQLDNAMV